MNCSFTFDTVLKHVSVIADVIGRWIYGFQFGQTVPIGSFHHRKPNAQSFGSIRIPLDKLANDSLREDNHTCK